MPARLHGDANASTSGNEQELRRPYGFIEHFPSLIRTNCFNGSPRIGLWRPCEILWATTRKGPLACPLLGGRASPRLVACRAKTGLDLFLRHVLDSMMSAQSSHTYTNRREEHNNKSPAGLKSFFPETGVLISQFRPHSRTPFGASCGWKTASNRRPEREKTLH